MKKTHVLLIDDDLDELAFFLMAMDEMPDIFKCTYVSSGHEALKLLDEIRPDFIFIDMNMPRWNGLECIKAIKKNKEYDYIPLILYSTSIDEKLEQEAHTLGVVKCLRKPFSLGVLVQQLRHIANIPKNLLQI